MNYINIIVFVLSIIISFITVPVVYKMLINNKSIANNYLGEEIPIGMGLVFLLVQTFIIFTVTIYSEVNKDYVFGYIILFILIGLIGHIDDSMGDKDIKGFKGHIFALIKGRLTTGGLKAVVGFGSSFIFSLLVSNTFFEIIINTLLISLFTNLINLFDLRPGRAIKAFIFISLLLLITSHFKVYNFIMFSALGIIIIYLPKDINAKSMLGDIGSNTLGMTLGVFCVLTQVLYVKLIYLFILIVLHIISEFYSFSKIIDKNKFLRYIDNLGRS